jgi:uncharacterized protein (TIGR02145 family)
MRKKVKCFLILICCYGLSDAQQATTSGQVLKWNGTTWAPGTDQSGSTLWTQSGSNIYYNNGNVGIGTTNPVAKLHANGVITSSGANFSGTTTVPTPVNATDAAIKSYVDVLLARIEALEVLNNGFTDSRDSNQYNAVKIGNQIWMAENLEYLPRVVGPGTGSQYTPFYYVHGYNGTDVNAAKATTNYTTYGVLYNWLAAMAGSASSNSNPSGVQGVCPTGWHLPSDAEWTQLTDYLGGASVAVGKLKETGTVHWNSPNTGATNETGFTALPGGYRNYRGAFGDFGRLGYWWSATKFELHSDYAWIRYMYFDYSNVFRDAYYKESGFSVRCVRD